MSTPNYTITDKNTNKEYWISRAIVVVPLVFKEINGEVYTLVEKRGKKVSHRGKWCCPCGYLDWDETCIQACIREVKEETGIELNEDNITFIDYNSNPSQLDRQNVSMRFVCFVNNDVKVDISKLDTKGEVDDLKWIKIGKIKKNIFNIYRKIFEFDKHFLYNNQLNWAFNHDKLIFEVIYKFYKQKRMPVV